MSYASVMAAQTTNVPFWIQIVAIALAPVIGFVGVALGAYWQSRGARYLALRAQRQEVYDEFLAVAERIHTRYAIEASTALQPKHSARLGHIVRQLIDHDYPALVRAITRVDLIGSQATVTAAADMMMFFGAANAAVASAMRDGYDQAVWTRITAHGIRASNAFRDAAARDLGVPRADRRRTLVSVSPELTQLKKDIRKMAEPGTHSVPPPD